MSTQALKRTRYVCQKCGAIKVRDHTAADEPLSRDWKARCISGACRGAKRLFVVAYRPFTGGYK